MSIKIDLNNIMGMLNSTESLDLSPTGFSDDVFTNAQGFILLSTDAHGYTTGNFLFLSNGTNYQCCFVNGEDGYIAEASLRKNEGNGKWSVELDTHSNLNIFVVGVAIF